MASHNKRRSAGAPVAVPTAGRSSLSSSEESDIDTEFCKQAFLNVMIGNSKGRLRTFDDFASLIHQTGRNPSQRALKQYWEKFNTQKIGIDLQGFLDVCRQEPVTSREELLEAFRAVDLSGDGYLTVDEFVKMLSSDGEVVSKMEARAILQQYDRDGDDKLDYQEFIEFVLGDIEKSRQSILNKDGRKQRQGRIQDSKRDRYQDLDRERNRKEDRNEDGDRDKNSTSPRPAPRRGKKIVGGDSIPAGGLRIGSGKNPRLTVLKAPHDLQRWKHKRLTGFFLLDETGGRRRVVSSHFNLNLPSSSNVYISMQPMRQDKLQTMKSECDLAFALFKASRLVAVCESPVGSATSAVVGLKADLDAGEYQLLPFCCGDRLSMESSGGRKSKPVTSRDKSGGHKITTAARAALEDIFKLCDTNQDGSLDKQEFQVYNYITSDEEVTDELWEALSSMVKLKNETLDLDAFLDLNRQELEGDNWSEENFWINLKSFGVNQDILMTGAYAFEIDVQCSECRSFDVVGQNPLKFPDATLSKGLAEYVKEKGSSAQLGECTIYWLETPLRVYLSGEKEGAAVPSSFALDASGSYGIEGSEAKMEVFVKRSNAILQQFVPTTPTYTFAALLKPT